jgi:hypothetical protein
LDIVDGQFVAIDFVVGVEDVHCRPNLFLRTSCLTYLPNYCLRSGLVVSSRPDDLVVQVSRLEVVVLAAMKVLPKIATTVDDAVLKTTVAFAIPVTSIVCDVAMPPVRTLLVSAIEIEIVISVRIVYFESFQQGRQHSSLCLIGMI